MNRPLEDLRISVTDRCNFRCTYCMPLDEYPWIAREKILTFEEISRSARVFALLGVKKLRITGGEPLVRKGLPQLVQQLSAIPGIEDIALTTNASRFVEMAQPLKDAGLNRVTVSIDTLRKDRFRQITQRSELQPVLDGIQAAQRAEFRPIKLNAVIERGVNDDEILDLVEFARDGGFEMRFIEYMDVGNANQWTSDKLVSKREILEVIRSRYALTEKPGRGSRPSKDYSFADGRGGVGVIASVTEPFCGDCSRIRLTADGRLVTCLFSDSGADLKALLRDDASDEDLAEFVRGIWEQREDRYSETRLVQMNSPSGYVPQSRKKIEMISLGG
jgi:cyclic pyranopterin phosphate synthase